MGLTLSLVNTGTPSAYTARPGPCLHLFRRPHWDALQSEWGDWWPDSSGVKQDSALGLRKWPHVTIYPLSTHLEVPPGRRVGWGHHFSARDQVTQYGEPFAHAEAEDLHQPRWGRALASSAKQKKKRDPRANRKETELGLPRQLRGGR